MPAVAAEQIRAVNVAYHDGAAADYDAKWNIRFDDEACRMVTDKLAKALGSAPRSFGDTLEIGAGTGYFTLNLLKGGMIASATATDISPGMLEALEASASSLGLGVETACCEASELPFEDASFDVVMGHAVLHHLPDLPGAFAEFRRVLRPGGLVLFCGEPSRYGDRLAEVPKRAGRIAAPLWRRLMRAPARTNGRAAEARVVSLEPYVDVHSFTPSQLRRYARDAGLEDVRVAGEELTCSAFGWLNRTLEATAEPDAIPPAWSRYAYGGYMALRQVDRALLEPRLPSAIFYNLMVAARAPASM